MQAQIAFGADQAAVDRVTRQLAGLGRVGVAFSGGVDSATLLALAVQTLGPSRVLAIVGVSPSLATDERTAAHEVVRAAVVERVVVRDRDHVQAGEAGRCP